jgi:hypothetical protein
MAASGCYTFKATSIDPNIKTFSVESFQVVASNAQPGIGVTLTEMLRERILRETRLKSASDVGDVLFTGEITAYDISPISPQANEVTTKERLTITAKVTYTDKLNDKNSWEKSFSRYEDYDSSANFNAIEETLIENISEQIVDEIFRNAFENW